VALAGVGWGYGRYGAVGFSPVAVILINLLILLHTGDFNLNLEPAPIAQRMASLATPLTNLAVVELRCLRKQYSTFGESVPHPMPGSRPRSHAPGNSRWELCEAGTAWLRHTCPY
jgi:hypothetical protein